MASAPASAKQRKRDAVGNLRSLADEVGADAGGRRVADLTATDFDALRGRVAERATTPDQQQRLHAAVAMYRGEGASGAGVPTLPPLPARPSGAAAAEASGAGAGPEAGPTDPL